MPILINNKFPQVRGVRIFCCMIVPDIVNEARKSIVISTLARHGRYSSVQAIQVQQVNTIKVHTGRISLYNMPCRYSEGGSRGALRLQCCHRIGLPTGFCIRKITCIRIIRIGRRII